MSALSIQVPFPVFQDRDGQPLDNGYVWLGTSSLNPQTNPVVAYYDSALTIVATQPLRTLNGFISRAGSPAQVYVDAVNFSILVQDSKGTTVFSVPEGTGISPNASGVVYDPAGTGAVATTVQQQLRNIQSWCVNVKDAPFYAVGDGVIDDTAAIQAAVDTGKPVYVPTGAYLVDPRVGLVLNNGTKIYGDGKANTIFVAMPYGGSTAELIAHSKGAIFTRQFNPAAANNYVSYVHLSDFAVILNHPLASITTTNIQIGIDLRHITRSLVENVWVGNINVTDQTIYTKTDPSAVYAAQGYGVVLGSVSSSDPAYCGGEVNIVRNCNAVGAYKGITLDDGVIMPSSASHSTTIERCDVQVCHHLLVQESPYSAGVQFLDNTLQSITKQSGDTTNNFVVRMEGYNGTISGGYVEAGGPGGTVVT